MMYSRVAQLEFSEEAVTRWKERDEKHGNWPVSYVLVDVLSNAGAHSM